MSIKADINTDANGNFIIHMKGGLDYETSSPLRKELEILADKNPLSTLTLDLHKVDFVGSSGICHFVETINQIHQIRGQIKLINVKPEFKKVFRLYKMHALEDLLDEFESEETHHLSQSWASRKRTFEN